MRPRVEWMTKKDPGERPESYGRLLSAILGGPAGAPEPRAATGDRRSTWMVVAAILVGLVLGVVPYVVRSRQSWKVAVATPDRVAVCPFWGPDEESSREGRVMAALVERSITERLGTEVDVLGIDRTGDPVRSHDDARSLGERLGASVVVWGEAITLRDDTEIQPSFTLVGVTNDVKPESGEAAMSTTANIDIVELTEARAATPLRLSSTAPDQIQMRRTSAEGVGEMVTFLAGLHSLHVKNDGARALSFFSPRSRAAECRSDPAHPGFPRPVTSAWISPLAGTGTGTGWGMGTDEGRASTASEASAAWSRSPKNRTTSKTSPPFA